MARVATSGRVVSTRHTFQIKEGTYIGTAVDGTNITDVGFLPNLVFIKTSGQNAVWRNALHQGDKTSTMASNVTNSADMIQNLQADGFQIGANASVNTNLAAHYYIAITGTPSQLIYRGGKYRGNSADNRSIVDTGMGFTPDFVMVKNDGTQFDSFRIVDIIGDLSSHFASTADAANEIQALTSNGFQLGTSARVNGAADYYYNVFKNTTGVIKTGSYTGTGVSGNAITGVGFQPDIVIVNSSVTQPGILKTTSMGGNNSAALNNGSIVTDQILSLDSDGFTVGSQLATNQATTVIYFIAMKAGNFNVPINRGAVSSRTVI